MFRAASSAVTAVHRNSRRLAAIIGVGSSGPGSMPELTPLDHMELSLERALADASVNLKDLHCVVSGISLTDHRFMTAHSFSTRVGLLPGEDVIVKTIDVGGATPVSALLEATDLIENEGVDVAALVFGDRVKSMDTKAFLDLADRGYANDLPSPVVPHGYDRVARHFVAKGTLTERQLAMVPVVMNRLAARHPRAYNARPATTVDDVLRAPKISAGRPDSVITTTFECAKRADGGAAIILASNSWLQARGRWSDATGAGNVVVLGGAEASGPLSPSRIIDSTMFSCETAANVTYAKTQLTPDDIDWWGLYDCFPICFLRACEAVGLAQPGKAGEFVERLHELTADPAFDPKLCPINTHGGLLGFGAPWEVPAAYTICEAYDQLVGRAAARQIPDARRALIYANGGIFSASSLAILGRAVMH